MSKHMVVGSDVTAMLACFAELKRKAQARTGRNFPIIIIQEAGLDGFWIHRVLQTEGIESHAQKQTIVALARKLLVAIWKYVNAGVVIEGAALKTA
jgi:transposase